MTKISKAQNVLFSSFSRLKISAALLALLFWLVGGDALCSSSAKVTVLEPQELVPGSACSIRVVVSNPADDSPLQNIPVNVFLYDEEGKPAGQSLCKTDEAGTVSPSIPVNARPGRGSLLIQAGSKGDVQEFKFPVMFKERNAIRVDLVMEHNDSGRCLVGRVKLGSGHFQIPYAGKNVTCLISDPRGRLLVKKEMLTDSAGFCVTRVPISSGFSGGPCQFIAASGETQTSKRFAIEEQSTEAPLVSLTFDRNSCDTGDTLVGVIKTGCADGRPLKSLIRLEIAACGRARKTLAVLARQTNDDGCYRFKSVVPSIAAGDNEQPWLQFTVKATKDNRTASVTRRVPVCGGSSFITLFPERRQLKRTVSNRMTLMSLDGDYRPQPVKVEVAAGDFRREVSTAMGGYASFDFTPSGHDTEIFRIAGLDGSGNAIRKELRIPVESGSESVLVRTDKFFYGHGEPISLEIASSEKAAIVYLDVGTPTQTVQTEWVKLEDCTARRRIALDGKSAGLMSIRAHIFSGHRHIYDLGWIYVNPSEDLRIAASPLKDRCIPGEMLSLGLEVFSPAGLPAETILEMGLKRSGKYSPCGTDRPLIDDADFNAVDGQMKWFAEALLSGMPVLESVRQKCGALLGLQLSPAEPSAGSYPVSIPRKPPGGDSLEEVYCYEPLVKVAGQVQKDILLPSANFEGEIYVRPVSGRGGFSQKIRVFQEFLCDIPLQGAVGTEGDSVAIPVKLVNFTRDRRDIVLELSKRDWFELKGFRKKKVLIDGYQDGFSFFDVDIRQPGAQKIVVGADHRGIYQEIRKDVLVLPQAMSNSRHSSGILTDRVIEDFHFPKEASSYGRALMLVLYNGPISRQVGALEAVASQIPVTSIESASRILLALEVITHIENRSFREKVDDMIMRDSSSLLKYEKEGGFSLFPAQTPDIMSTAWALAALGRVKKHYDINEAALRKTMKWLLDMRGKDGAWPPDRQGRVASLTTTAAAVWALLECGVSPEDLRSSLDYLKSNAGKSGDLYALAWSTMVISRSDEAKAGDFARLLMGKVVEEDGGLCWKSTRSPLTDSCSPAVTAELTGLCLDAIPPSLLGQAGHRKAMKFLMEHQFQEGSWGLSPASFFAARGLWKLYGGHPVRGTAEVLINGRKTHRITCSEDDREVFRRIDLSGHIEEGATTLSLLSEGSSPMFYEVLQRYYGPKESSHVKVLRSFDKKVARRGERIQCTLQWTAPRQDPVVVVEVPVPWGLKPDESLLSRLQSENKVLGYDLTPGVLSLSVPSSQSSVSLAFVAEWPGRIWVRPAWIFFRSDPDMSGASSFGELEVR